MNLDLYIEKFGLPQCAVCGKSVDRLDWGHDVCTQRTRYTVCCHGQVETVYLDAFVLYARTFAGWAPAFATPRLPPKPPGLPGKGVA